MNEISLASASIFRFDKTITQGPRARPQHKWPKISIPSQFVGFNICSIPRSNTYQIWDSLIAHIPFAFHRNETNWGLRFALIGVYLEIFRSSPINAGTDHTLWFYPPVIWHCYGKWPNYRMICTFTPRSTGREWGHKKKCNSPFQEWVRIPRNKLCTITFYNNQSTINHQLALISQWNPMCCWWKPRFDAKKILMRRPADIFAAPLSCHWDQSPVPGTTGLHFLRGPWLRFNLSGTWCGKEVIQIWSGISVPNDFQTLEPSHENSGLRVDMTQGSLWYPGTLPSRASCCQNTRFLGWSFTNSVFHFCPCPSQVS